MATNSHNTKSSPRKISREKGVEVCLEMMLSGQKPGEIVRTCMEKYGVSTSAVEKWMQIARPQLELRKQELFQIRKMEEAALVSESVRSTMITREAIEMRLWQIANGNLQDFFSHNSNAIPLDDLPRETASLLKSISVDELYHGVAGNRYWVGQTKKFELHDPLRAIDMLNKMRGYYKEDTAGVALNIVVGYGKEVPV